jgi:ubiquinone/menaquinone biosynthesis C-methylase UbiE
LVIDNSFEEKIGTTFNDYQTNPFYNHYHKYSHEKVIKKFLPDSNGRNIVDLGCGTGTYYDLLKNRNYKTIYGVDLSQKRILIAKQKGYITFNALAQELPFENYSIDGFLCIDMFVHVLNKNEREKIFKSVHRVLKNNGFFIFSIASKKGYLWGDYGVDRKLIFSNDDGIINDYCALMDFREVFNVASKYNFKIEKIVGTQFDFKLFKFIKRIFKEKYYHISILPFFDFLFGNTFLKEYGKAVFFKLIKI